MYFLLFLSFAESIGKVALRKLNEHGSAPSIVSFQDGVS